MMRTMNFVKTSVMELVVINGKLVERANRKWYLDFPEWTGSRADLEMVGGADKMLDIMAEGGDKVSIEVSNTDDGKGGYIIAKRIAHDEKGGTYQLQDFGKHFDSKHVFCPTPSDDEKALLASLGLEKEPDYTGEFWLCNVTHYMFGDFYRIHPEMIFFSIIK